MWQARAEYRYLLEMFTTARKLKPPVSKWSLPDREAWYSSWQYRDFNYRFFIKFDPDTCKVSPPAFHSNCDRLTAWVLLWPWSIAWLLFRDGVVRSVRWALTRLGAWYEKIAKKMFEEV